MTFVADSSLNHSSIRQIILEKESDFILSDKDSRHNNHKQIMAFFKDLLEEQALIKKAKEGMPKGVNFVAFADQESYSRQIDLESDHGRTEIRIFQLCDDLEDNGFQGSEDIKAIGLVYRVRIEGNIHDLTEEDWKQGFENAQLMPYMLSSSEVDIQTFSDTVRDEWEVENRPHYVLDDTFGENRDTLRDD